MLIKNEQEYDGAVAEMNRLLDTGAVDDNHPLHTRLVEVANAIYGYELFSHNNLRLLRSRNKREGRYVGKREWLIKRGTLHFHVDGKKYHHRGNFSTTVNRKYYPLKC